MYIILCHVGDAHLYSLSLFFLIDIFFINRFKTLSTSIISENNGKYVKR